MSKNFELTGGQKVLLFGGLGIAVLVVAGPVLAMAAASAFDLLTLAAYGGVLFAGYLALPWAKMKWKNIVLKLIKAEARKNPIETLQNELLEKRESLNKAAKTHTKIKGMRGSLKERLDAFKEKHNTSDARMEEMLKKTGQLLIDMGKAIKTASSKIDEFERTVELESDRYEMALASGDLAKAYKEATGGEDPLRKFIENEALNSVRDSFHQSMAEIDELLLGNDAVQQLSLDETIDGVIDMTPSARELEYVPSGR